MAKVVRVYGKADSFDIELIRNGDMWEVEIPPDMKDGVYAVELTAIDVNGDWAFWAGELFMANGVCCMKIKPLPCRSGIKVKEYASDFCAALTAKTSVTEYLHHTAKRYYTRSKKTDKLSMYMSEVRKKTDVSNTASALTVQFIRTDTDMIKRRDTSLCRTKTEILFRKGCCHKYG